MRRLVFFLWVIVMLSVVGCGGSGGDAASDPDDDPEARAAFEQMESVVRDAARPRIPRPGFKVRASRARHLHGLDLMNAVVFPMVDTEVALGPARFRRLVNRPQYVVYAMAALETEIDDGGMVEIYYNGGGDFAAEGVSLLRELGAARHARVLAAANRVGWPDGHVPRGQRRRQRVISIKDSPRFTTLDRRWDAAEIHEGALDDFVERYIRARPASFFD